LRLLLHLPYPVVQDHVGLPAEGGEALLQLAVNCSDPDTAAAAAARIPVTVEAAARRLPALLQPEVARKLLITAATRQHIAALQHLATLAVMREHMDAATLEDVLRQLLKGFDHERFDCFGILCKAPEAAQLNSEAVQLLLLTAVHESSCAAVLWLCRLPAARQLSSGQVECLIQTCIEKCTAFDRIAAFTDPSISARFVEHLGELPGGMQLSSNALVRLLHAAIRDGDGYQYTKTLSNLPAAAGISSSAVTSLLRAAFQSHWSPIMVWKAWNTLS
jgi:hypothetical protein